MTMRVATASLLLDSLYEHVDGYYLSSQARKKQKGQDNNNKFVYGDVSFLTWKMIVEKADPKKDGVFFDLGSGIGGVVIASYLMFDFQKSIGIELLEDLYYMSRGIKRSLDQKIRQDKSQDFDYLKNRESYFINDNIFNVNLSEADFIFINYPLWGSDRYLPLEEKLLRELKPKTKIVKTIRPFKNPAFKLLNCQKYKFSWGMANAYFYEI